MRECCGPVLSPLRRSWCGIGAEKGRDTACAATAPSPEIRAERSGLGEGAPVAVEWVEKVSMPFRTAGDGSSIASHVRGILVKSQLRHT
jgi:hypothetical protein